MRPARIRGVCGRFDRTTSQEATVTIDRDRQLFAVRPMRRRREYVLPLALVAEIVCQRIMLGEANEKRKARKAR